MFYPIFKLINKIMEKIKRKLYGKTFFCPVCHLELSFHDANKDGLLVCPLCGIVIEITEVFGHPLPVVHDVAIKRYQPKLRIHPLSTHIPIGLFPFALIGILFLFLVSIFNWFSPALGIELDESFLSLLPLIKNISTLFLILSVSFSILTFISGYFDWYYRYEKRPYRIISLKIYFSIAFIVLGILAIFLQIGGLIFDINGLVLPDGKNILLAMFHFLLLIANMIILATLGHVGGLLVFGM